MTSTGRERSTGTVLWFSRASGRGIIERDATHEECVVHRDALDGASLRARDRVEFDVVEQGRGLMAERVSVIRSLDWEEPYAQVEIGRAPGPRRLFRVRSKLLRFVRL
jgi:CspA family cold shock protein